MTNPVQLSMSLLSVRLPRTVFVLALVCALAMVAIPAAQAQTFTVLHSFTDGGDGAFPSAGLTLDHAGNLYGTASLGGNVGCSINTYFGCGAVFKLTPHGAGWTFSTLYAFTGGSDGEYPLTPVVFGPDGSLYGTTALGGIPCTSYGCGTVFKLQPPARFCGSVSCPWSKTELYQFTGGFDGAGPATGSLTFDHAGNIYGTSGAGSSLGPFAVVYELSPSHGSWSISIPYSFANSQQAATPDAGVVFDAQGNLWGTTLAGGAVECGGTPQPYSCGIMFKLTQSETGWAESTPVQFDLATGGDPYGNLILDHAGNIYGTTSVNGPNGGGDVYEQNPSTGAFTVIYAFSGAAGPLDGLVMDGAGSLYGTTSFGGANHLGSVFRLTPSNGGWIFTDLHDFTGGADGATPNARVVLDGAGNIYGVASDGGGSLNCRLGCGTVWRITP